MSDNTLNKNEPRASVAATVVLIITATFFSVLGASGFGGLFSLMVSSALLGLLLIAQPSFVSFLPIPLSFVAAVALTGSPLLACACFLTVPVAFALRICYAKKCCLSVTVISCTIALGISYILLLALNMYITFGSVTEGLSYIKNTVNETVNLSFSTVNEYAVAMGREDLQIDSDSIYLFKKSMLMVFPGIFVVFIEIAAYCTEKLMRLFAKIFRCNFVLNIKSSITLGLGAAIIFVVSYLLYAFFAGDTVLFYSAENLMLAVMPAACLVGIFSMFGKNGFFRRSEKTSLKVLTVLLCVTAFLSSPYVLLILFALWGSTARISRALSAYFIAKNNKQ